MKQGSFHSGRSAFLMVLIGLFLLIIYSNSLQAPFVYDDWHNIVKRPALHLTRFTPDSVFQTFFKESAEGKKLYRPLSCFSFALNYYFGKLHITGYHLVNILIHMLTAYFLF